MLCLTTKNRVIAYHEVSRGQLDASIVHPREVFKVAILANAAAIIVAHIVEERHSVHRAVAVHPRVRSSIEPELTAMRQEHRDAGAIGARHERAARSLLLTANRS